MEAKNIKKQIKIDNISKIIFQVLSTPQAILSLAIIYQLSLFHYLSLLLLCLILFDIVHRTITTPVPLNKRGKRYKVVIAGAGFSGLCMGKRLKDVGVNDFVILEKSSGLGGTWRHNVYPGVACDINSHAYCFSFFPNPWWSLAYSKGSEIWNYLEQVSSHFDLDRHIRYNQNVLSVVWQEDRKVWIVTTDKGEVYEANFFVHGTGGLHYPNRPNFKNQDHFHKPILHSAEWDSQIDLYGKRVAVIGTGASAVQLVPGIAERVKELYLFQRTPAWIPNRNGFKYWTAVKYMFFWIPWTNKIYRSYLFLQGELFFYCVFLTDSFVQPWFKWFYAKSMRESLKEKPELARHLIPKYDPGCRRICPSDVYLKAIQRPNVHLIFDPILEFTPEGILTKRDSNSTTNNDEDNKVLHYVDLIALATGYDVLANFNSYSCTGKGGRSLEKEFGDTPTAYMGVTRPGFPNLFIFLGPSGYISHISVIFQIECQVNYAIDCMRKLSEREDGTTTIEVKETSLKRFVEWLKLNLDRSIFHSGCVAYGESKNVFDESAPRSKSGFAWALWPKTCTEFWWATYACLVEDYDFE